MRAVRWFRRARGSVRLRVTLLAAGAFAVVLVVAALALVRALEGALEDDVRTASEAILRRQAALVLSQGIPADARQVSATSGEAFQLPVSGPAPGGGGTVVMFVGEGSTLPERPPPSDLPETEVIETAPADVVFVRGMPVANPAVFGIEGPVDDYFVSSLRVGGVVLATAASLQEVRDTIATTRTMFWIVGPVLVALVAGLAWLLAGRALRPVHAVTSRVAAIGSHSLHARVPVPTSSDEIAELATTMNDMLGRLEASSTSNRRLVSDASHELRTPVTVMRTELEVAGRSPVPDWQQTSAVLLGELDRLQWMIDDLLLLARGDERAFAHDEVDVTDLVREVAGRRRRVPVGVEIGEQPVVAVGDADALRRALDHIVSNAARHAAATVSVSTELVDSDVRLHVDDDGPGIPEADRERVLQRFVRSDDGRARDGGGSGLGLAVASDVALGHHGRLVIGDSPLGGARVTVSLPWRL
jgi:signal transduction histidine kinase